MLATPRTRFSTCSWETGTLVFATLNLIVLAAGVIGGFAGFLATLMNIDHLDLCRRFLACAIGSGFQLVFAALLFHGVLKKTPEHIKAYFVFGALALTISCFLVVAMAFFVEGLFSMIHPFYYWDPSAIAAIVIGQVIYALILTMIYKTYRKMEVENLDEQEHFLIENMNEKFVMPLYFKA